ncbi:hypothetical protein DM02DRAFT_292955 [Periconia macrospinosa]|uniref:Wings apart-like protein C-terminal domain-containing protein n=1 Tax=Periconia macrospinosa TaxID=97972 RepID=A0A2V1DWN7_9PLEO|nr:hypothetical protein DM02DRAFT_292955 [Periconia macrospinosa]
MAMPMSSTFTAPERRKKVTTYGKPGRLPSSSKFFGDTPSPERPRKQARAVYVAVRKPAAPLEIQRSLAENRAHQSKPSASLDIFDVPSDNEASSSSPPEPPIGLHRKIPSKTEDSNVFDLPPSEDDTVKSERKIGKRVPSTRTTEAAGPPPLAHKTNIQGRNGNTVPSARDKTAAEHQVVKKWAKTPLSPTPSVDSDMSQKSNKRKRRASVSSSTTGKASVPGQKPKAQSSQREKKHQKKTSDAPSTLILNTATQSNPHVANIQRDLVINKNKRTRVRTTPALSRAPVTKGQSSPAQLHTMLVHRTAPKQPPTSQVPQAIEPDAMDDDTMYEPKSSDTPQIRNRLTPIPGSVTPRQQAMFNNLLGDSSDSATPMPKISALKLSERKPSPTIANLIRSCSDIPQTTHTRKARLLDVLKQTASSSDEESESDEEAEEEIISIPQISTSTVHFGGGVLKAQDPSVDMPDAMDVDIEPIADSQTSQTSIHLHTGSRITYAKNRSYLAGPEPDLANLLDNMDDDLGLDSPQNQERVSDEDEDGGQLRGIHDLRRQGQQHKFQTQAEATIEEVSGKGLNASQRRSAMMECATQMNDKNYVNQLLESSLMSSLLRSISSTGEIIFDFAAATAVLFILASRPGYAVLEQIHQSAIMETLDQLLASKFSVMDIHRISKERKVNMAPRARETVAEFRELIVKSNVWAGQKLDSNVDKISPQLVAIKVLELLVVQLRQAGNGEPLVDQSMVARILDVTSACCTRLKTGKAMTQDYLTLEASLSIMESLSLSIERQNTWSTAVLTRLADMMPVIFEIENLTVAAQLAIRLCINVTNDRPRACQLFSKPTFILPLLRSINHDFEVLGAAKVDDKVKNGIMENVIFSLGAMMNLAESSKQVRVSAIQDGGSAVEALVSIFLKGSKLADEADSMEESHFVVRIGYLTVLLGNLCLDHSIRQRVCELLPGNKLDMLIQKTREFVLYNQKVDRIAGRFEGFEGGETHKNFTARLMMVVERLEGAAGS